MDTLQITKDNALKAYNEGCDDVKKVMCNLFGKENFIPKNIMDRVKTFEDALMVLGKYESDILPDGVPAADSKSIIAYCKLIIIARALNEGWVPDWKDQRQYKYYPWFDMSSGSGLSFDVCGGQRSNSYVGSRLCFKTAELAKYAGTQFIELYKDFFII
jgi:hypothetical protein